jgi:hypothetical protein
VLLILTASIVVADWDPIEGHNMHFPQLPDADGWDVEVFRHELADDWRAADTYPITEIHFWTSWESDDHGVLQRIHIKFYDDAGGVPGTLLWSRTFTTYEEVNPAGNGIQGWYAPEGPAWYPNNHIYYQLINIENIDSPFVPAVGQVYWLSIEVDWDGIQSPVGWKTSQDHFGAVPVWWHWYQLNWAPLTDPQGAPLSLAFVVGPQPPVPVEESTWGVIKDLYR